jgi:TetR/AcrR family transcriptional repressor of nem operon
MKKLDTKTHILTIAQDLIQRVGVNAMSYRDISEAIGIRKAGVHYHFPTKEELLLALLERYSGYVLGMLEQIITSPEAPETKMRRYCALFETTLSSGAQDKACLGGMMGAEVESLNPALSEQLAAFYRANESGIAKILIEGQQAKDFEFAGDSSSMACLIFSMLQGGMLLSRVKNDTSVYRSIIDQLIVMVKA